MKVLIIGGSGFVSGTLARRAVEAGHDVWTVTRGERAVPDGVTSLTVDRKDSAAFARTIGGVDVEWDLVADCICYRPEEMEQDLELFLDTDRVGRFVFISTDFVYEPTARRFPQGETDAEYIDEGYGYEKRQCELLLEATSSETWTVLRPCHIYGPGSLLGCLPEHSRDAGLIDTIRSGRPLRLVGGGRFLQQPVFVRDLADAILSAPAAKRAGRAICNIAGPDIIESKRYYEILAERLGTTVRIEEIPVDTYLAEHPEKRSFLCHRINDLTTLERAGLAVPSTGAEEALTEHLESLL